MGSHYNLSGLILGGGQSRRMGRDKSDLDYHGKSQRKFLFDLLSDFCDDVYFSCKNKTGIPHELNPLEDAFTLDSPLNGILSAFSVKPHSAWLTLPVDMPNIHARAIQFLLDHRNPSAKATCFFDSDGKYPEPLFTLWEPAAGEALRDFFEKGGSSPRAFLISQDINVILAPENDILTNINSPEDLDNYRKPL